MTAVSVPELSGRTTQVAAPPPSLSLSDSPLPATAHGVSDEERKASALAEKEALLSRLRRGKRILVVDDSACSCEFVIRTIGHKFPDCIDYRTDARQAEKLIIEKNPDVLILDMDMPGLSGRQLLLKLAKRGISIPTVILSGGQGDRESRQLLFQLCAAQHVSEFREALEEHLSRNNGLALTYLPKEQAALKPEYLHSAVDAMLLAKQSQSASSLSALQTALRIPAGFYEAQRDSEGRRILAALADEFVALFGIHHMTAKELNEASARHLETPERASEFKALLDKFSLRAPMFDIGLFTFPALLELKDPAEFEYRWHELMGSRGLHGAFGDLEEIKIFFPVESQAAADLKAICRQYGDYVSEYTNRAYNLRWEMQEVRKEKCTSLRGVADLIVKETRVKAKVLHDLTITCAQNDLKMALHQAVVNAGQAVERMEDGAVQIEISGMKLEDLPANVSRHFQKLCKDGEKLACITIKDNGGGFPDSVLNSWNEGAEIISTKTQTPGTGLKLMRECIARVNSGFATIGNEGDQAVVRLYCRQRPE